MAALLHATTHRGTNVKYSNSRPMLLLLTVLAAGCTTTGTGFGSNASGANPVNVSWKSSDRVSGAMDATTADGTVYTGQYFQVTADATLERFGPGMGLGPWGDSGSGTLYSGQVVADLASHAGARMRCTFRLIHPSAGMAGGGGGLCQTPTGTIIDVNLRKS
jgi:hypothetical protein